MSLLADIRRATRISNSRLLRTTLRRASIVIALPALAFVLEAQTPAQPAGQSTSTTSTTSVKAGDSKSALATPAPESKSAHLNATPGPAPEDVNRKALEENAGRDAGKILVRSVPTRARIYINGAFVGYAPQLFVVAPGKYKIELRGQRDNYAERTLGLLPNDTQEISLNLTGRYPFHVGSHLN